MHIKPVRYKSQRRVHFITFSCYRRMKLLDSVAARNTFEQELERVRRWYGCFVTGYVTNSSWLTLPPERGKCGATQSENLRKGWASPLARPGA